MPLMSAPSRGRSGRYYDGFTATIRPVTFEKTGTNIALKDSDGHIIKHWRCDDIRIVEDLPGQGYRLGLDSGERQRLVVEHPDAIAFIDANCANLRKGAGLSWQAARPYVLWGGGALISILLLFFVIVPAIAPRIATVVPVSFTERLGTQIESYLVEVLARTGETDLDDMYCSTPEADAALTSVLNRLTKSAGTTATIGVIKADQPNALALPGGRILVFSGLIEFSYSANELAGVMAHEVGHVKDRHGLQRVVESSVTGALIGLLFGDTVGATAFAIAGDALLNGAYSREKEEQADEMAIQLMAQNGWTAKPMAALFRRMERQFGDQDGVMSLISSHPTHGDRIDVIREQAGDGVPAWSHDEWKSIKAICGDG